MRTIDRIFGRGNRLDESKMCVYYRRPAYWFTSWERNFFLGHANWSMGRLLRDIDYYGIPDCYDWVDLIFLVLIILGIGADAG